MSLIGFRTRAWLAFAALAVAGPTLAANYPLELIYPRAAGSSPATGYPAISANNRIFRAYPGIEYNIRAAVIGGGYPYTYSLSNAPSGMTIDARTGLIVWPNPTANATPTISVTDTEGTTVSSNWTITVTTNGFLFIDSVGGAHASGNGCSSACGTGTRDNPWRSISDMVRSGTTNGQTTYFRTGTYTATDLPRESAGSAWERVEIDGDIKSTQWVAYPGERPIIDFMFRSSPSEAGPLIRLTGANIWIDGFETTRSHIIGFQITSGPSENYRTFRRLAMHDNSEPSANNDGSNASYIMTTQNYGAWSNYMVVQDSEFYRAPVDPMMKIYSQRKLLVEDNLWHDAFRGIEIKADVPLFTLRKNVFYGFSHMAIGGNMDEGTTSGEMLFNLVRQTSDLALDVNQNGTGRRIDIYRNTFIGRVQVRNTDSGDGPFRFYNNVIVSNDSGTPSGSHIYHSAVSDTSRVVLIDNLVGFPNNNIVTATGALADSQAQYRGTRGYELGNEVRPRAPTSLIVR